MQDPAAAMCTVVPDTEHTVGVWLPTLTVRVDEAVALRATSGSP